MLIVAHGRLHYLRSYQCANSLCEHCGTVCHSLKEALQEAIDLDGSRRDLTSSLPSLRIPDIDDVWMGFISWVNV